MKTESRKGIALPRRDAPRRDHIKSRTTGPDNVADSKPPKGSLPKIPKVILDVAQSAASDAARGFAIHVGIFQRKDSQGPEKIIKPAIAAYDS